MTLARFQMKLKQMSISQTAFPRVYGKDKAIFSIIRSSLVVFLFKAAAYYLNSQVMRQIVLDKTTLVFMINKADNRILTS